MKKIFFILFFFVFIIGCDDDLTNITTNEPDIVTDEITTEFKLCYSNGVEKTSFKSGEDFEMRFSLTNLSGKDQSYHYTGIPVIFEIHQNDSIISTSVDGLIFPMVLSEGVVRNNETFQTKWQKAPNPPAINYWIILPVGNYKAVVDHQVFFDSTKVKDTLPIDFVIIN